MPPLPTHIRTFLAGHHVVSLAASHNGELWSASCFYVFDEAAARLIVLTSKTTHHGRLMLLNHRIAGTIAGQPARIRDICGIQFAARAECLTEPAARRAALELYAQAHPMAKVFPSDIWQLSLDYIKHTSNRPIFAHKTHWRRNEENS
ncbi:pyridoxamine 5'-phosphate oxidase family protein [Eikenella sp. Marseille-P7795]|uniref:pyridoxamine 5'-phosphate oxidase family protein n=1 Tax=Eikenella sp. Marseille-P7795 TaxID=2866577 RepID=UPI001CE3F658|nr:pyridoxamine 5'-phosphate oxidase family protein [Eikenella sp. Marseille-P7795]